MKLLEETLTTLPENQIPIRKGIVGVHWTLMASKYCGLASTMVREEQHDHSQRRWRQSSRKPRSWR